jgi:hypothetical protein
MPQYFVGDRIPLDHITHRGAPDGDPCTVIALFYLDRTALIWQYPNFDHNLDLLPVEAWHNVRGDDVYDFSVPNWREDRVTVTVSQVLATVGEEAHYLLECRRPGDKVPFLVVARDAVVG